jgi:uncharacterized protein GlcG (DUF336 family)
MSRSHRKQEVEFIVIGLRLFLAVMAGLLFACSDGSGGDSGCDGECPETSLSSADVRLILAQAYAEALENPLSDQDRNDLLSDGRLTPLPSGSGADPNAIATVVVLDRVGNVLGAVQTPAAGFSRVKIDGGRGVTTGLDGLSVLPAISSLPTSDTTITEPVSELPILTLFAAVSKAGSAAYLSSQGNAFTSRTASQIIQENFNPGETRRAGGPLFGVQFSQLPCGDFVRSATLDGMRGPKQMPLGLAGDPGGLPLYKGGVLVGAVGVEVDGVYGTDLVVTDIDQNPEERIATAASRGFKASILRRAERIPLDGRTLRYADDELVRHTGEVSAAELAGIEEHVTDIPSFYCSGTNIGPNSCSPDTPEIFKPGATIGTLLSGIRRDDTSFQDAAGEPVAAEVLVGPGDTPLYPPIDSIFPSRADRGLSASEVQTILEEGLAIATRMRSQIRKPSESSVRINVSVVDLEGNILGFARRPDAPLFGADVSLQKARTAAFFSRGPPSVPAELLLKSAAELLVAATEPIPMGLVDRVQQPDTYLMQLRGFLGRPNALNDGVAFSDRAGGNLSRPFFPDGINGRESGPLSRPFDMWSPFSTGAQLDLTAARLIASLQTPITSCTAPPLKTIRSGTQIFPGSVPVFRKDLQTGLSTLIGGVGVSGDGVDQDDMVAFLSVYNAGLRLNGAIQLPPRDTPRADTISVDGVHLRFISCPPKPYLDSDEQAPCEGK